MGQFSKGRQIRPSISTVSVENRETPTCPGGSLRNSNEVASDLARSKVDVCETHLMTTTVYYSVGREKIHQTEKHTNLLCGAGGKHVLTYLAGITTVIGTLNSGPQVEAAVSYPHT